MVLLPVLPWLHAHLSSSNRPFHLLCQQSRVPKSHSPKGESIVRVFLCWRGTRRVLRMLEEQSLSSKIQ